MTRGERARQNFREGCNCAQAVALAYADLSGVDGEKLAALTLPLGGGLGRLRETCGAVTGAAVCLGFLFEGKERGEMYALVQEFARRFRAENGSINCGELLSRASLPAEAADRSPSPAPRTPEYYKKRPCAELVFSAASILEEMIKEN